MEAARSKPDRQISIYDFAETCEALFDRLLTVLSAAGEDHYQTAQQLRSSFERWAGFLGVFAAQHVSLDRRLESSPQIRDRFIRLLKVVERNAEHALGFESARRQIMQREDANPPSKADAGRELDAVSPPISPGTEVALQGIQEALEGLHRIGVAVRKTSTSSLTFRVKKFTQKAKDEFDFYERMDLLIVKGLYPRIQPSLAKQLAETVSFRRARLQFQRSRQTTLETRRVRPTEHTTETPKFDESTQHIKDVSGRESTERLKDRAQSSGTRSATSTTHGASTATDLTPVDNKLFQQSFATEEIPGKTTGSSGPLTVSGVGYSNPYPRLPNAAQCNWCFRDHKISREDDGWKQAWKDHFKRDLEPYVCISEECSSNLQYFVSLRDWRHHMNSQHTLDWIEEIHRPATWFCETGDHDYQDFETEAELRDHLQAAHSVKFDSEQQDTMAKRNVVYVSRSQDTCPLCGTDVARLLQNIPLLDPPSPPTKPQPLAKPSSPSKKSAKQLRFETPADPVNSDEEDYDEASHSHIDASEPGEPLAEVVQWRTNQIRLSTHVAAHLKSLAFTSLRYFEDGDDASGSQGSRRAASGDAGEMLSSEEGYGDHYFGLDELNPTSFQDIPRDQRYDEEGTPPPDPATTAVWGAIRTKRESSFASIGTQDQESTSWLHRPNPDHHAEIEEKFRADTGADLLSPAGIDPILPEVKNNPSDLDKILSADENAYLMSLSFPNINSRQQAISPAYTSTCDWFFDSIEFRQWRDRTGLPNHNGVLWIKGKPATGKSTLMKHTLGYCQRVFKDHIIASYFFNASGDELEKTTFGMLRSLLCQLIEKEPSTYERFVRTFPQKEQKHRPWRESELREFVLSEVQRWQAKPLLILVDALDECNEPDLRNVVNFLEELSIKAIDAKTTLNICLSSRHFPLISMKKCQVLVVEERREHDEDITKYVRSKLAKSDTEIEEGVIKKASGILQWVLLARRPLTPEELYFATEAGENPETLGPWDSSYIKPETIRRRILHSSRGLVEVRKSQRETVQFIHESIKDFLSIQGLQIFGPTLEGNPVGISHDSLKSCCMSYLMMKALPLPKGKVEAQDLASGYPLLQYASTYVLEHAEEAQARDVSQEAFVRLLQEQYEVFERVRLFHDCFERDADLRYGTDVSLLYALSIHGHGSLVKSLFNTGRADINVQDKGYGNALRAASMGGHENIVRLLLEQGADIESQDYSGQTPLLRAALNGHEAVVRLLLEKGAELESDISGQTPLLRAAKNGHEVVVRLLLEQGADIESKDSISGQTPLSWAAKNGHEAVVRLLLEKGADIESKDESGRTPLLRAVENGHEVVVRLLLEKGADIESKHGIYGQTPLLWAAENGHEVVVRLLLEKGAGLESKK